MHLRDCRPECLSISGSIDLVLNSLMQSTPKLSKEAIVNKIHIIRGLKVMLSNDLASLYQVETKVLNQQVKWNINRFPVRYMFKLTTEEYNSLRSQNVTLKRGQHSKYPQYEFSIESPVRT